MVGWLIVGVIFVDFVVLVFSCVVGYLIVNLVVLWCLPIVLLGWSGLCSFWWCSRFVICYSWCMAFCVLAWPRLLCGIVALWACCCWVVVSVVGLLIVLLLVFLV